MAAMINSAAVENMGLQGCLPPENQPNKWGQMKAL
jgi:hypothetical protein